MRTQLPQPDSAYPYVRLWCRFMGSYEYYAVLQEDQARATGAPRDAVYEVSKPGGSPSGVWVTLDNIHNSSFIKACALWREGKMKESDGWPMS
jgi:hypothetical protein